MVPISSTAGASVKGNFLGLQLQLRMCAHHSRITEDCNSCVEDVCLHPGTLPALLNIKYIACDFHPSFRNYNLITLAKNIFKMLKNQFGNSIQVHLSTMTLQFVNFQAIFFTVFYQ
jgi:hypothetical protein